MKLILAGEVDELSNFLITFSPMDLSSFFFNIYSIMLFTG